jgi:hypothetical protein
MLTFPARRRAKLDNATELPAPLDRERRGSARDLGNDARHSVEHFPSVGV